MKSSLLTTSMPVDVGRDLGTRVRELRLARNWSRATLAARAGVTSASLKRFENSGKSSLDLVLRVDFALQRLGDFDNCLAPGTPATLADLEREIRNRPRRRGRQ